MRKHKTDTLAALAAVLALAAGGLVLHGALGVPRGPAAPPPAPPAALPLVADLKPALVTGASEATVQEMIGPPVSRAVDPSADESWGYRCRDGILVVRFVRGRLRSFRVM